MIFMACKIRHNATATYRPKCFVRFFFFFARLWKKIPFWWRRSAEIRVMPLICCFSFMNSAQITTNHTDLYRPASSLWRWNERAKEMREITVFCFFSSIADITAGAVVELCAGRVPSITTLSRDTGSIPFVYAILVMSTFTQTGK